MEFQKKKHIFGDIMLCNRVGELKFAEWGFFNSSEQIRITGFGIPVEDRFTILTRLEPLLLGTHLIKITKLWN